MQHLYLLLLLVFSPHVFFIYFWPFDLCTSSISTYCFASQIMCTFYICVSLFQLNLSIAFSHWTHNSLMNSISLFQLFSKLLSHPLFYSSWCQRNHWFYFVVSLSKYMSSGLICEIVDYLVLDFFFIITMIIYRKSSGRIPINHV